MKNQPSKEKKNKNGAKHTSTRFTSETKNKTNYTSSSKNADTKQRPYQLAFIIGKVKEHLCLETLYAA
jgi:hypothetical protein